MATRRAAEEEERGGVKVDGAASAPLVGRTGRARDGNALALNVWTDKHIAAACSAAVFHPAPPVHPGTARGRATLK